ncbi:MAG: outer membrane protein assembly factor BamA [Fibrobacterota bacterium]
MKTLLLSLLLSTSLFAALPDSAALLSAPEPAEPQSGHQQILRKITVRGNANVSLGLIQGNFALRPGDRYSAKEAQESLRSLYEMGLFSDIRLDAEEARGDSFTLVITVQEHPLLHKVEFTGNKEFDNTELEEKINLLPGTVLTPAVLNKAKNKILDAYREKGFLLAEVQVTPYESKESGKTVAEFKVAEGKKIAIEKITIRGAALFPEKKIKGMMQDTKEDRWWRSGDYNEEKFLADLNRIEEFYHDQGYLDARVTDHDVAYSPDKKSLNLTIGLFEGKRYFFGRVFFSGNALFSDTLLQRSVSLKKGDLFSKREFDLTRYTLESAYREEGYLYVQLTDEKLYRGDTIDLHFDVKEGMPAYINRVAISGNTKTWDKVIRREISLRPGDIYRQSLLMLSQRDLLQTNYFDQATPDIQTNADRSVDLIFGVQEKETGTGQVSAGAGYSQRDGFVFTTGLSMPNFAVTRPFIEGGGQSVDLQVEYGKYSRRFDLGFTEPWLWDTPTLAGFRAYYTWRDWYYSGIDEISKGGELRLGRRLKWPDIYFRVYSTYDLSHREYRYSNSALLLEDKVIQGITIKNSGFESILSLRLSRNSTDLPDFPTKGSVVEYNPSVAGYFLGGDYRSVKHRLAVQAYLPTFGKFTLLQGATFAHLSGEVIGRYDHFLAGGVNYEGIIRGYPDRSFGDLIVHGDNVGYNLLVYTTELRYPVLDRRLYLGAFADFGNTWASLERVNFADLKTGVGLGVKLLVPMLGLLGFDVAFGLDDYPDGVDAFGNTTTYRQVTGEKPPYFEFHFRIGKQ